MFLKQRTISNNLVITAVLPQQKNNAKWNAFPFVQNHT